MRKLLVVLIVLESLALLAAGGLLLGGVDEHGADLPAPPIFRPPIYDAVIGDSVRYQKRSKKGALLGYLEYRVDWAEEYAGTNLGRSYRIEIIERDEHGKMQRRRLMLVRPRDVNHGFLPPMFNEDLHAQVPGARPVIKTIRTAPVELLHEQTPGFLLEAVVPRDDLTKVAERYWITPKVPVFGVARWERRDGDYVVSSMVRAAP